MGLNWLEGYHDSLYTVMRILAGLLFLQHGIQKLFGGLGGEAVSSLATLTGVAGFIEFFGGLFITIGLLTRVSALVSAVEMLAAFFYAHVYGGIMEGAGWSAWVPIMNGGESALLFFAVFLIIIAHGAKQFGIDAHLRG